MNNDDSKIVYIGVPLSSIEEKPVPDTADTFLIDTPSGPRVSKWENVIEQVTGGWSIVSEEIEDGERVAKKIISFTGGVPPLPQALTDLIGKYFAAGGGFTSDISLATNYKGTSGEDGKGVTSITKTSTVGNIDTYTIEFSDGDTSTFEVTNGTNAKIPTHNPAISYAAGSQILSGSIIYEVMSGQTLAVGELPANFVDVKVKVIGGSANGGNLFELFTSFLAGVPKTLSGNSFTPILDKKPVSVEVFAGGVKQYVEISYIKNGSVYDVIITSDVDIFNADVNVFGSNLDFKELEDVNNFGRFVFSDDSNIRTTTDNLIQLRDVTKGNALGPELIINNSFSDASGWTVAVNGTWEVSGGKLRALATNAAGNTTKTFATINGVFRMRFDVDSVEDSITVNGVLPNVQMSTAGTREIDLISTATAIGFRKTGTSQAVIDNVYAWRILGNHLVQPTVINAPKVYSTYVEFDGINDTMQTAVSSGTIGSMYIVAQRVGTDADFVVLNSLSGIGEISGGVIYIGSNAAKTTFHKVRIKEILIRSVTDSPATISKLNKYYTNLLNS